MRVAVDDDRPADHDHGTVQPVPAVVVIAPGRVVPVAIDDVRVVDIDRPLDDVHDFAHLDGIGHATYLLECGAGGRILRLVGELIRLARGAHPFLRGLRTDVVDRFRDIALIDAEEIVTDHAGGGKPGKPGGHAIGRAEAHHARRHAVSLCCGLNAHPLVRRDEREQAAHGPPPGTRTADIGIEEDTLAVTRPAGALGTAAACLPNGPRNAIGDDARFIAHGTIDHGREAHTAVGRTQTNQFAGGRAFGLPAAVERRPRRGLVMEVRRRGGSCHDQVEGQQKRRHKASGRRSTFKYWLPARVVPQYCPRRAYLKGVARLPMGEDSSSAALRQSGICSKAR